VSARRAWFECHSERREKFMKSFVSLVAVALLGLAADTAVSAPPAGNSNSDAAPPAAMQEQMKLMQSQMEQIAKTQDPKERQRLLQDHMAAMQKMLAGMQGMSGGCMSMHPMMEQMAQHQHWMMMQPPAAAPPPK
jgi:hypothetical protein